MKKYVLQLSMKWSYKRTLRTYHMSVANEMGSKLTASGAKETRQTKHQKQKNKNQQIYKQSTSISRGGTEKKDKKR